jgi:hypothetical protein
MGRKPSTRLGFRFDVDSDTINVYGVIILDRSIPGGVMRELSSGWFSIGFWMALPFWLLMKLAPRLRRAVRLPDAQVGALP